MNILAGEKLKNKNPNKDPASANPKHAITGSPANANQAPNAEAAINPTPPANPSTPSIRLKAFTTTMYVNNDKNIYLLCKSKQVFNIDLESDYFNNLVKTYSKANVKQELLKTPRQIAREQSGVKKL
jgi:hypothetical protein